MIWQTIILNIQGLQRYDQRTDEMEVNCFYSIDHHVYIQTVETVRYVLKMTFESFPTIAQGSTFGYALSLLSEVSVSVF
jgi:hypothetical protein